MSEVIKCTICGTKLFYYEDMISGPQCNIGRFGICEDCDSDIAKIAGEEWEPEKDESGEFNFNLPAKIWDYEIDDWKIVIQESGDPYIPLVEYRKAKERFEKRKADLKNGIQGG